MKHSHKFFTMAVVSYQTLNIGELLHLLPCDLLRNNVRLIAKLNKRFINAKYGNIFNETCISERLFPKCAYIHTRTLFSKYAKLTNESIEFSHFKFFVYIRFDDNGYLRRFLS